MVLLQNVLAANGKGMCGLWVDGVLPGLSWENCSLMKRRGLPCVARKEKLQGLGTAMARETRSWPEGVA